MKKDTLAKYCTKKADLTRPLEGIVQDQAAIAIVIPAYHEQQYLFQTLESLQQNSESAVSITQVIVVVNNRKPDFCEKVFIEDNQQTLARLCKLIEDNKFGSLAVSYIDASSPGTELPEKEGVGLARKIGMDRALDLFYQHNNPKGIILSLDADTLVEPAYIESVLIFFKDQRHPWAAVIDYEHRLSGNLLEDEAIVLYELFLRYHVLGLKYAGSPYAFHSIGSALACTAEAYAAVSGMCRKQAGEDFYFLQQLAKTGTVGHITTTKVYPSSRASERVPFGTGRRISQHRENSAKYWMTYPFFVYEIIRQFTDVINSVSCGCVLDVLSKSKSINDDLYHFLVHQDAEKVLANINAHAKADDQVKKLLHQWFDGFMIIKFIHFVRDQGAGEQPLIESIHELMQTAGYTARLSDDIIQLLNDLRNLR